MCYSKYYSPHASVEPLLDLRLVGGNKCQGRLELKPKTSTVYGQACNLHVGNNEAKVVCRQLGCEPTGALRVVATRYVSVQIMFDT